MHTRLKQCFLVLLICAAPSAWPQGVATDQAAARLAAGKPTLRLSLKQAVDIALGPGGNARVQMAEELIRQAQSRSAQARAALLPSLESTVGQQNLTRNLRAYGIQLQLPIPGFVSPTLVGPFGVFDARATASQSVFDLSSLRRFQASKTGITLAEIEKESAEDQVRDQVARSYLAAIRAEAALEAAVADVRLAEALVKLASDQKAAGTATGIEVTRARVQLANEKQRLLVAENNRARVHLQLLKAIGLNLDATLEFTEKLAYIPIGAVAPEQAIQVALESRADWKAQQKRLKYAKQNYGATRSERLPSLGAFADYGSIGSSIDHAIPTYTLGFAVRVPIFDGGRRDARRSESASLVRQEEIRTRDLGRQIELDVRIALDGLRSAAEQVRAAEEGLSLADGELAQAQRRYREGVGSSIEITDAQARLERARENRTTALFNHNLARIDLGTAMGTIRQLIQ